MKDTFSQFRARGRSGRKLLIPFVEAVVCFSLAASAYAAPAPALDAATTTAAQLTIKVDQVGYPLDAPKVALVSVPANSFKLQRSGDNQVVFEGKLGPAAADKDSGDQVQAADFSAFHQAGTYYLSVPGVGRSWDFSISKNVYERAYYLAMRAFYGQRCGTAVDLGLEFPGYSHPACHLHGELSPTSGTKGERNNIGGWHDAGDYGRYVVNSGISTGTLLWAWEIFGNNIKGISLKIPESGKGTPDLLSEARWNIEWMLKMQDDDGGVWHKQTSTHFSEFIPPEKDTLPSEVIGTDSAPYKSTCATADLAAVSAIAARVYAPYDAKFAARTLESSRRAWAWAEQNPNVTFRNPQGITTGEYGDRDCRDEMLWAAAELSRTTGEGKYNAYFLNHYAAYLADLDSPPAENWAKVAPMGLWSYALSTRANGNAPAVKAIRERTVAAAQAVVERTKTDPFHVSLKTSDYVWGSNGVVADYGKYLLLANLFQPEPAFVDAARDNLHYLLGRNTFSLSFVTQLGENPFQHPHHRPSASQSSAPWPGLLSGGPNANRADAVVGALPLNLPPARVYTDQTGSYSTNEIAINWQASLVFLLAGELQ